MTLLVLGNFFIKSTLDSLFLASGSSLNVGQKIAVVFCLVYRLRLLCFAYAIRRWDCFLLFDLEAKVCGWDDVWDKTQRQN